MFAWLVSSRITQSCEHNRGFALVMLIWGSAFLWPFFKNHARSHRPPFTPSLSTAFRLLLLVRFFSAMYSNISDCDESKSIFSAFSLLSQAHKTSPSLWLFLPAFNYWEPLHLLTHPPSPQGTSQSPFQTWEYHPQYAIRSWAYLSQYVPVAGWLVRAVGGQKVQCKRVHELTKEASRWSWSVPISEWPFLQQESCLLSSLLSARHLSSRQ